LFHPLFEHRTTAAWQGGEIADDMLHDALPLEQLLQERYETDAHSACYVLTDENGDSMPGIPRLGVGCLSEVRQNGGNVWMRAVAVDLDTEPHVPWESMEQAGEALELLTQLLPQAAACITQRGLRLIFKFQRLVEPEDFFKVAVCAAREVEAALRRIEAKFPLTVDDSCGQWSRMFRLPNVVRSRYGDAVGTEDSSEYSNLRIPSPWVPWFPGSDALRQTTRDLDMKMANYKATSKPATSGDGGSARVLALRASLVGPRYLSRPIKDVLAGRPFYKPGERNNATFRIVAAFFEFGTARGQLPTAEEVFALFEPSATAGDNADASAETWSIIQRAAHRAAAVLEIEKSAVEAAVAAAADSARVPAVVYTNKTRWIWNALAREYGAPISNDQTLMAEITRHHPIVALSDRGKMRPMHAILRSDGVMVQGVTYRLGRTGSQLVTMPSGAQRLEVGVAPMVPVTPRFHQDCADYLEAVVGSSEDGHRLTEWIATCGHLDRATPVLLLRGRPSAGKSLIASSLAQLFGGKCEFSRVMGRFNGPMLETALIHLDEGVDADGPNSHVSNRFRSVSANEEIDVERKGVDPVSVRGNYRIVVTSNSPQPIPVANAVNLDGFEAIAIRVLPLYLGDAPRDYLESIGGRKGTADWVSQDVGGHQVPGRLAEHFSYIQETVKVLDTGGRFLVPTTIGTWHVQHLLQGILRNVLVAAATGLRIDDDTVISYRGGAWIQISDGNTIKAQRLVATHSTGDYTEEEILHAVVVGLKGEPPRRIQGKVYYPLPTDILLALAEPENADVFVEEAEQYEDLKVRLAATA
jgi:hypothetical protein